VVARLVRDFSGFCVSAEDWPVVLMEFPEEAVPDGALLDGLTYLEQLLKEAKQAADRPFTIVDLTRMRHLAPAKQRKCVAEWMDRTVNLQKAVALGGASVTPSTVLRGLVTAIFWIAPPKVPTVFVATRREAYERALRAYEEARIPLPLDVRGALARRVAAPRK
jgi:hypothetical protein